MTETVRDLLVQALQDPGPSAGEVAALRTLSDLVSLTESVS